MTQNIGGCVGVQNIVEIEDNVRKDFIIMVIQYSQWAFLQGIISVTEFNKRLCFLRGKEKRLHVKSFHLFTCGDLKSREMKYMKPHSFIGTEITFVLFVF